jgi:hypothetical protein
LVTIAKWTIIAQFPCLMFFFKNFRKIVVRQLNDFLETNNLVSSSQFGFSINTPRCTLSPFLNFVTITFEDYLYLTAICFHQLYFLQPSQCFPWSPTGINLGPLLFRIHKKRLRLCSKLSLFLFTDNTVSPSARLYVWRILVSSIPLVCDGNRFLCFLY